MVIKYRFSVAFVTLAFFKKYQLSQSQLYLQVTKKTEYSATKTGVKLRRRLSKTKWQDSASEHSPFIGPCGVLYGNAK